VPLKSPRDRAILALSPTAFAQQTGGTADAAKAMLMNAVAPRRHVTEPSAVTPLAFRKVPAIDVERDQEPIGSSPT
jgi:hypothetical protein